MFGCLLLARRLGVLVLLVLGLPLVAQAAEGGIPPTTDLAKPMWYPYIKGTLVWYHTCPGDNNQDGLVNSSDISRFGRYFDYTTSDGSFRYDNELSIVDGNGDGWITTADLTTIGLHFGCDVLGGYNLYCAESLDDYPASNGAVTPPGAVLVAHLDLADTVTNPGETSNYINIPTRYRLRFAYRPDEILAYDYWWVRPVSKSGVEGSPSDPLRKPGMDVPVNYQSAAVARWDAASRTLSWYYYNYGDFNLDGLVEVRDITMIGIHNGLESDGDPNSIAGVIDIDGSGVVDPGDEYVIAQNWDHCVCGYKVYVTSNEDYYPTANDARPQLVAYSTVEFINQDIAGDPYRPLLSIELPDVTAGQYLWVRPYDYIGYEGTPSNLVVVE